MKFGYRLSVVLGFLVISGCSLIPDKVYSTANIISLFQQASNNHAKVVEVLKNNLDKFTDEEKEVLAESYIQIESSRQSLAFNFQKNAIESFVSSGQAISKYGEIRQYYGDAILIVEGKLSEFSLRDRLTVGRQIDTVKRLDAEVSRLLTSSDGVDQRQAVESMINLLTIVGKILLAMGV